MKLTDEQAMEVMDYMFGDDESDVTLRTVKVVKTRKPQVCMCAWACSQKKAHPIDVGTTAVREKAIVDGKWCSSYVCMPCAEEMADKENLFGQHDDDDDFETSHLCSVCQSKQVEPTNAAD